MPRAGLRRWPLVSVRTAKNLAIVITAALLLGATRTAVVILRFQPEITVTPSSPDGSPSRPIRIEQMVDARGRTDPMQIGENLQNPGVPIPVRVIGVFPPRQEASANFVTDYTTQALITCLTGWGIRVEPGADLVLKSGLLTLFVTEANSYKGEARVKFRLEEKAGNLLWEGIVAADDSTWGRDLNPENYNLVIANALKKTYTTLMSTGGFTAAWAGKPALTAERMSPAEMKAAILRMLREGLTPSVVAEWVGGKRATPALSSDDLVEWKREGIPDEVTRAAIPQRSQ